VVSGVGAEGDAPTTCGQPAFVKASILSVLVDFLEVKNPTVSETGKWYDVPKIHKHYSNFMRAGGAQSITQAFSLSRRD